MPKHEGPDLLEDRDVPKYDYISFMQNMMDRGSDGQPQPDIGQKKLSLANGGH
jgi:Ca2+ insensitive EF hand